MSILFLDSSALVKLYVLEAGSEAVLSAADDPNTRLAASLLARVECRAALRKKQRLESLDPTTIDALLERFESDFARGFTVQPVDAPVMEEAVRLTDVRLVRAFDALQLASCLVLKRSYLAEEIVFCCADRQLLRAAVEEGLLVLNPSGTEA